MATIDEIYTNTTNVISAMSTAVTNAVGSLNTFISGWNYSALGSVAFQQTGFTYPTIGELDSTVAANFLDQDHEWRGAAATVVWPTSDKFPTLENVITPIGNAKMAPIWDEDVWDSLKNQLKAVTDNITAASSLDSTIADLHNVPAQIQNALYQQDYERKSQALRDAFSASNAETGRKGFTFPNMMTTALQLSAQQAFLFDLSQTARDLMKLLFDWARNNYQFSIQQRMGAHNSDAEFNLKYQETLIKVYEAQLKAVFDEYRTHLETELEKTNMLVKEYQTRVELVKTSASSVEAQDRNRIAQYAAEARYVVDAFAANNDVAVKNTQKALIGYTSIIEGAAKMAGAVSQISLGTITTASAAVTGAGQ